MDERAFQLQRRRALLTEIVAIEEYCGIPKPVLYLPVTLAEPDEKELAKHYTIVREARPVRL